MMRNALIQVEDSVADTKPNYKTTDMLEKLANSGKTTKRLN
jgi:hypothetical protein